MLNLNTNLIHNIINALLIILPALLVATGCVQLTTGDLDCGQSWINPTYTTLAMSALAALKIGLNLMRDGIGGLWKVQPPIRPDATIASPGTKAKK